MKKKYRIALVGATGFVGKRFLSLLEKRAFPIDTISLFASDRSVGEEIFFKGNRFSCQKLEKGCFEHCDLAFFDIPKEAAKIWCPQAAEQGAWVIDHSTAFRLDPEKWLIVPEINGQKWIDFLKNKKTFLPQDRLVTGPNCTTVPFTLVLDPLKKHLGISEAWVATYQSISGMGLEKSLQFLKHTQKIIEQTLKSSDFNSPAFSKQNPFVLKCVPQIGSFDEQGYSEEERKLIFETFKILETQFPLHVTSVRVPTLYCHGEVITVECKKELPSLAEVIEMFSEAPGVKVHIGIPPTAQESTGEEAVYLGRIRKDLWDPKKLHLWLVGDNLLKGAALNALQIGELLISFLSQRND